MSKRRQKQSAPGRASAPRHDMSSIDRLTWARTQWRENIRIPINGDSGMIRLMKQEFGLAASYESLSDIRNGVRKENDAEKRAQPAADKPPPTKPKPKAEPNGPSVQELNMRKARAKRSDKANERLEYARKRWMREPWISARAMRFEIKAKFKIGAADDRLREIKREVLDALGHERSPQPPKPEPPPTTPPPAPPVAPAPAAAPTEGADADSLQVFARMILDDFPDLAKFELVVDRAGNVSVGYEFHKVERGSLTLQRGA